MLWNCDTQQGGNQYNDIHHNKKQKRNTQHNGRAMLSCVVYADHVTYAEFHI